MKPTVVVVGLGPAGPELITAQAQGEIDRVAHRFVRTTRHPAASVLADATSFDELYERYDTFEMVYHSIADELCAAAQQHGEVLYAVPGSPWVLERTVRYLLADARIDTRIVAGMSFLDLAYARLHIDPIEASVRLIDGHTFAVSAAGLGGPLLVAHCHDQRVMSDIKLAIDDEPTEAVIVLQRLGCHDELITSVKWEDLDRNVEPDHLTALYIPALGRPVAGELMALYETTRRLRVECPWDRSQTHATLAKYAVEETNELVEAIGQLGRDGAGDDELIGELGDVLFQVVLHCALAEQDGRFSLADVAETINAKMIRRHPHVFGDETFHTIDELAASWERIKAEERAERNG